jgi:F-type H+-transporting ATPase subunit gamma
MATAREIRHRIRSVTNIAQVTSALEAVSASKVRRAQEQVLATRAYAAAALDILHDIAEQSQATPEHPLLTSRKQMRAIEIVLITSNRGLAGPYNFEIVRTAIDFEKTLAVPVRYVTVGRKGRDLMVRRGVQVVAEFSNIPEPPSLLDTTPIARTVIDDFLDGKADKVYLAYTDFVNTLNQTPTVVQLLPLQPESTSLKDSEGQPARQREARPVFTYEPSAEAVLDEFLPRFTELQIYQALLESLASEHSARMVAMRNATENAHALVDDLTLSYNKARQLAITSEMMDIVGGSEALETAEG